MKISFKTGDIVFGSWVISHEIGEGSFGKVYSLMREDFGATYTAALKVISVPQNGSETKSLREEGMSEAEIKDYFYSVVQEIVKEFAIMAELKGTTNIVGYEDHQVISHEDGMGWDILIRMELLTPLLEYAYQNPFSRRDIIKLGIDICNALELCQKYNIIHRDLKPENIFVSKNGDFKLGDFGIARTIEKTTSGLSKKGTYSYIAPEVYKGHNYGFSVDIYSLGIVLYRLLNCNRLPFMPIPPQPITFNDRERALISRMSGEKIVLPFHSEGRLPEIVLKACSYSPKERYSTPVQLRTELASILYDENSSEIIYPEGDSLALKENSYLSSTNSHIDTSAEYTHATQSVFAENAPISMQQASPMPFENIQEDKTQSVFGQSNNFPVHQNKTIKLKKNKKTLLYICITGLVSVALGIFLMTFSNDNNVASFFNTHRTFPIEITADGETYNAQFTEGTVADALETIGIVLNQDDYTEPSLSSNLIEDMSISVHRVTYVEETRIETLSNAEAEMYHEELSTVADFKLSHNSEYEIVYQDQMVDDLLHSSKVISVTPTLTPRPLDSYEFIDGIPVSRIEGFSDIEMGPDGLPVNYTRLWDGVVCTAYFSSVKNDASGLGLYCGTVAVNPNLIPYGTRMYITSADGSFVYGFCIATDTSATILEGHVDLELYFDTFEETTQFGRRQLNVYVLD